MPAGKRSPAFKVSSKARTRPYPTSHFYRWHTSKATNTTTSMSDSRLFRFPKPAWLNSATTRSAGVYAAGALVCTLLQYQLPGY